MRMREASAASESRVAAVLFLALFLASADNQLLIPLVPTLGREFGLSVAEFGVVFSVYALSAALFNLVLGPVSDRVGRLPLLRAGLMLFGLSGVATSLTGNFTQLLLLRAVTGVAGGLVSTCSAGFIGDQIPYRRRGKVMGFVLSSYFGALVLGVPASAWVAEAWGWRTVFLGSAGLALATLSGTLLVGERRRKGIPEVEAFSRRSGQFIEDYRRLVWSIPIRGALVTSFLTSGGTLAFLTYISGYLSEEFSLSATRISLVFLVSGVAALLASPVSGMLSDRFTKRQVFLLSNTLLAMPLLALSWLGCGFLLFASIFLISLCVSFRQTALQTLQTELIGAEHRGSFIALRNSASQLGISLAVYLAGILYIDFGYPGVTALAAVLTLAGSAMLFFLTADPGAGGISAGTGGSRSSGSPGPDRIPGIGAESHESS